MRWTADLEIDEDLYENLNEWHGTFSLSKTNVSAYSARLSSRIFTNFRLYNGIHGSLQWSFCYVHTIPTPVSCTITDVFLQGSFGIGRQAVKNSVNAILGNSPLYHNQENALQRIDGPA